MRENIEGKVLVATSQRDDMDVNGILFRLTRSLIDRRASPDHLRFAATYSRRKPGDV